MHYRREIDGLRAVAVLPVILFHAGFTIFSGGFVGVDVFFVISGYLITSIIIGELTTGTFSIINFYERRARRILPALFFVILCCIPFAWLWLVPSQLKEFGQSIVAVSIFASNIHFLRQSGYFEPSAEENILLHTWSLAVEEQYYVFFPILLLLLWRFGRSWSFYFVIALTVFSLTLSEWAWRVYPSANFYLAPTRAWELLAGSICAFLLQYSPPGKYNLLSVTGLMLVLFSIFAYDGKTPFPSVYAIVPVGGTVLIILFGATGTWVARLLSTRAFVGIGLISYSAYLWHQPLFAFARIRSIFAPPDWVMILLAVASFGLAFLSWRFVEQPFRRKHNRLLATRSLLFGATGFLLVSGISFGVFLHLEKGVPDRKVAILEQPLIDKKFQRDRSYVLLGNKTAQGERAKSFIATTSEMRVLVFGDSHSKDMFNALVQNQEHYPDILFLRMDMDLSCLKGMDGKSTVEQYLLCPKAFIEKNRETFASTTHVVFSARWHQMDSALKVLEAYIQAFSAAEKTLIVTSNTVEYEPEAPDLIRLVARDADFGADQGFPKETSDHLFHQNRAIPVAEFNENLKEIVKKHAHVTFLEKADLICEQSVERCESVTQTGDAIYYDYGHWTLEGAKYLGNKMVAENWLVFEPAR